MTVFLIVACAIYTAMALHAITRLEKRVDKLASDMCRLFEHTVDILEQMSDEQ